ncbi:hypothetical protein, partial [Botryobacter ruber]|uniref:hypothetical protein n=1 Tax=Botryobacter ruber TaxID=2171629 RepID=UPI0013E2F711
MPYSRSYLKEISQSGNFGSDEHIATTEDLMNKLFEGDQLSLAEEEYICSSISILHSEERRYHFNTFDFEGCKNYNFRTKYLTYYSDLNCYNKTYDYKGELTAEQRGKDRVFLESESQKWFQIISNDRQTDKLLDYVSKETRHQIKLIDR